jgi:curved DNA-binding protein CbpA
MAAASTQPRGWREVLELPTGKPVTLNTARGAYRRLAGRHHPNKGGDHRRMQDINQAWTQAQAELGV